MLANREDDFFSSLYSARKLRDLINICISFPEYLEIILMHLTVNAEVFVSDMLHVKKLTEVFKTNEQRAQLFSLVTQEKEFKTIVSSSAAFFMLARLFTEHRTSLIVHLYDPHFFKKFISDPHEGYLTFAQLFQSQRSVVLALIFDPDNIRNILLSIGALARAFGEYDDAFKEEFFDHIHTAVTKNRLALDIMHCQELVITFFDSDEGPVPTDYHEKIFALCCQPGNLEGIIQTIKNVQTFHICFPDHSEELILFLMQPGNFARILHSSLGNCGTKILGVDVFSELAPIFKAHPEKLIYLFWATDNAIYINMKYPLDLPDIHRDDLFKIICHKTYFATLTKEAGAFHLMMQGVFIHHTQEKCEYTLESVLRILLQHSERYQAYVKGAVIGALSQGELSQNLSNHLSGYLSMFVGISQGGALANTCKAADHRAKEERDSVLKMA